MPQTAPGTQAYTQAAPPQGYYAYPPPQKKGGDTPGWVLVGAGVALAVGAGKVMEFVGGKKGDMQSMMLQQMMKQMGNQAGGGAPGGMPGMPGGMPGMGGMPGGMPGMPGMPGAPGAAAPGAGGFPPFPPPNFGATPPKPAATPGAVDVSATEVKKEAPKAAAAAATATAGATAAEEKKEESGAVGSGSFFADATDDAGPSTAPNPFADAFAADAAAAETVTGEPVGEDGEDSPEDLEYMQNMLRNPQMQEMMYPYLPEMMRNPETFEMLLSNPMYKDQLKGIMKQMKAGGGNFAPQEGMPDMNSPEVQEQFAAMGMTPQDAISKLMGDPELAMAFQNPKIQQAVMDCSSNPNNIVKYQSDPEIMNVFMKLATMFPGAGGGMPPGGMPPM